MGEGEGQVPSVFLTVDNMKPMEWKQLEFLEDVIQYVSESSNLCQWIKTIMKNIFVLGRYPILGTGTFVADSEQGKTPKIQWC